MAAPPFSFNAIPEDDRVRIHLAGEFDVATAPQARTDFDDVLARYGGGTDLVVDLSGVTFMDSTAFGVLVAWNKAAPGRLSLGGINERIARTIEITGLHNVLPLEGS